MDKDRDLEASPPSSPQPSEKSHGIVELPRAQSLRGRLVDSFKRNPNARVTTQAVDAEGRPLPDQPPAEPALAMKLKNRHLQMIAIGGSIGTPGREKK
jgi:yeast amino acid transporter